MTDLLERLREVEETTRNVRNGLTTNWYRNPDGPEAADEIERLREKCVDLTVSMLEAEKSLSDALARLAEAEALLSHIRIEDILPDDRTGERIDAFLAGDKP